MYGLSNVYYVDEDVRNILAIDTYLISVIADTHWPQKKSWASVKSVSFRTLQGRYARLLRSAKTGAESSRFLTPLNKIIQLFQLKISV